MVQGTKCLQFLNLTTLQFYMQKYFEQIEYKINDDSLPTVL